MADSLINSFEELDLLIKERLLDSNSEDILRDAIATFLFTESGATLYMERKKFGQCQDDGTIFINTEEGWCPIRRNESKFGKFAGSILGSKVNSMFAQSVNYLSRDLHKEYQKFTLLTHNKKFYLIKNKDNAELIKSLCALYDEYHIAPYLSYTTPNISIAFAENPLKIYRSWDINENFRYSEVINAILLLINEPD